MKGNDILTIFITFIFGLLGGFYFFLTGYAPYVEDVKEKIFTSDTSTTESLIIVGKEYGGCERSNKCASFQLQHDGTYSYLGGSVTVGAIPIQGNLTRNIMADLRQNTLVSTLRQASKNTFNENCASYVDGVDYNYEIVRNGEVFVVDTCKTKLSQYPDLETALTQLWSYVGF